MVALNISAWTARKYDKKATEKTTSDAGAAPDAGRFNKALLGTIEQLQRVSKAANAARTFHYANTLPWMQEARILPTANFLTYTQEMRALKTDFDAAVLDFLSEYPTLKLAAIATLNGLYQESDYPQPAELPGKFKFETAFSPVPDAADFRLDLAQEDMEKIKAELTGALEKTQAAAMRDLWERLHDAVQHMAERLASPDAIFRDSLLGNLGELVQLLPRLNIANDPALATMTQEVEQRLCGYAPDSLRKNPNDRANAAQSAAAIAAKMGAFMGGN